MRGEAGARAGDGELAHSRTPRCLLIGFDIAAGAAGLITYSGGADRAAGGGGGAGRARGGGGGPYVPDINQIPCSYAIIHP